MNLELSPEWREILEDGTYTKIVMGGEGSAKSFHAGLLLVVHLFYDPILFDDAVDYPYWIVGADFQDAQKEFKYVQGFLEQLDYINYLSTPNSKTDQWVLVTKAGQRIETISSYDPSKIARETLQGLVGAEFSRFVSREIFDRCMGRIIRRKGHGSWGFFSGSYESSLGWLPDLVKSVSGPNNMEIRTFSVPSWANRFFYPEGREDPAIKLEEERRSPESFMERFGAVPAPPRGIIFHEFRNHLHVDPHLDFSREHPVYLFIDPGDTVYCVLFVQLIEGECRVVDEMYVQHWTHEQVITEVKSRPQWPLVKGGAIDIAAKQAHMGMSRPIEAWQKDTGITLAANKYPVDETIERVRVALAMNPNTGRARLRIHPRCKGLIAEMGGGPSPVEGGGPWMRMVTSQGFGPPKNSNDHACKALGYGLAAHQYQFMGDVYDERFNAVSYLNAIDDPHSEWKDFLSWFKGQEDEA